MDTGTAGLPFKSHSDCQFKVDFVERFLHPITPRSLMLIAKADAWDADMQYQTCNKITILPFDDGDLTGRAIS